MDASLHITLAHGNGGCRMRELIQEIFAHHLANPALTRAAVRHGSRYRPAT